MSVNRALSFLNIYLFSFFRLFGGSLLVLYQTCIQYIPEKLRHSPKQVVISDVINYKVGGKEWSKTNDNMESHSGMSRHIDSLHSTIYWAIVFKCGKKGGRKYFMVQIKCFTIFVNKMCSSSYKRCCLMYEHATLHPYGAKYAVSWSV